MLRNLGNGKEWNGYEKLKSKEIPNIVEDLKK